jgi:hypothetical protein
MQSLHHPVYTYDALGRLINYTPSGATNDVVSEHILLDPRIPGPRSLLAGGLKPVFVRSKNLPEYVPPLSITCPPIPRPKTPATLFGYSSFRNIPEMQDVYAVKSVQPIFDTHHDTATKREVR